MDGWWGDLRFAVRSLSRNPSFTVVAALTLALGIGANTAIFSVVDGVLLQALPYDHAEDLVTVWSDMSARDGSAREWLTPPDFEDLRSEPGLFEAVGGWGSWAPTLTELGDPTVLAAAWVTPGSFGGVLRVPPFLGRGFLDEEDHPGAAGAVVVSHAFWRDRLAGDRGALGRAIVLDEQPHTVVGVMPEGFRPPFVPDAALWRPGRLDAARCARDCYGVRAVARLSHGSTLEVAREHAGMVARRLQVEYPDTNQGRAVALYDLREDLVGTAGRALWVLLGAVAFVLLIACTNVANLLLSRGAARRGEMAVRVALGAGRGPLLRQLVTESLLLAAVGGIVGLGFAAWGTDMLLALAPVDLPGLGEVGLDARALGFTAAVTLGTGLFFGLVPAVRTSHTDVYGGLARAGSGRRLRTGVRSSLVVGQVAMAMVLLVGAGLLIRSFQQLDGAQLGYEPEGVLTVRVGLPTQRFADGAARVAFFDALLERLGALPGVVSVGATSSLPLVGDDADADFRVEGAAPPTPADAQAAWVRPVTPSYFYTIGQRVLDGRELMPSDHAAAPLVVIVNETLAERYFDYPRGAAVGERIAFGSGPEPEWRTIVGVVADTRHFEIRDGVRPAVFCPYAQLPRAAMTMVLRADGDASALASDARAAVTEIDPALAASSIAPMSDLVDSALATDRFVTTVLGVFAFLAVVLAAVGLYGVVSYGVSRRIREMGIRQALGAAGEDVRRMVIRSSVSLTALGIAVGTLAAVALTRVLEALLYDVSVTDPLTYVVMIGTLGAVAVLASWLPAARAGSADPVSILREE